MVSPPCPRYPARAPLDTTIETIDCLCSLHYSGERPAAGAEGTHRRSLPPLAANGPNHVFTSGGAAGTASLSGRRWLLTAAHVQRMAASDALVTVHDWQHATFSEDQNRPSSSSQEHLPALQESTECPGQMDRCGRVSRHGAGPRRALAAHYEDAPSAALYRLSRHGAIAEINAASGSGGQG